MPFLGRLHQHKKQVDNRKETELVGCQNMSHKDSVLWGCRRQREISWGTSLRGGFLEEVVFEGQAEVRLDPENEGKAG